MPIAGLSDDVRMPRLGKIHLGIRVPVLDKDKKPIVRDGKPVMRPEKTEYFVLPPEHSDYKRLVELFGPQPKELRILIPVEDDELWATQYYKAYDMSRGLVCKGNGEMATRMIDIKTSLLPDKNTGTVTMKEITCLGKGCPEYKAKKCGETMNLKFILPEVPGLGVWQIDTGSINSILNINSCALMIKKAFGRISMVPLTLSLEDIQVNNPDTGKKQTAYVLNLRSRVTMAQLADVAREQSKTLLLQAPNWEEVMDKQAEADIETYWGDNEQPASGEQKAATEAKTVDKKTGEIKPKENAGEHFCKEHNTKFFKTVNMRSFGHPMKDAKGNEIKDEKGKTVWCHEHSAEPAASAQTGEIKAETTTSAEDFNNLQSASKTIDLNAKASAATLADIQVARESKAITQGELLTEANKRFKVATTGAMTEGQAREMLKWCADFN